jgi:hypothetical protein
MCKTEEAEEAVKNARKRLIALVGNQNAAEEKMEIYDSLVSYYNK